MLLHAMFLVAIAAEAMTAALAAGRRNMDWFGVCLLASITALGGGTVRDLLLGHYPLTWVADPTLLLIVCAAALATILFARIMPYLRWPFLLLDALGLVVFTILGCDAALTMGLHPVVVIVSGMITGIVGGILRDVLTNEVPLVFSSELYATVSIATGVVYTVGLGWQLPHDPIAIVAIGIGFVFRALAIYFRWEMPKFVYHREWR